MTVKINQICNYIDILGLSMIPKFNKGAPRAYILFLYKVIIELIWAKLTKIQYKIQTEVGFMQIKLKISLLD